MTSSRPASHFEQLYKASADPWGFRTSAYEQAKYASTVAALDGRRFAGGLEVGCSIGVLTRMLAPHCARLLGVDIVEAPLAAARQTCADQPWVRFERMAVPAAWPADRFDLIVLSEVLYFLSAEDVAWCARRVTESLLPGGTVVLVNWLGETGDPSAGALAPERFIAAAAGRLRLVRQQREPRYRLDVLSPV